MRWSPARRSRAGWSTQTGDRGPASNWRYRSARRRGRAGWTIPPRRITTDQEGRFRIEALLPGYEFRLSDDKGELLFGDGLRSGQTKDLGDVRMTVPKSYQPKARRAVSADFLMTFPRR